MLQEAGSYLTEVGVIIVVLFLQVSHEAHLKPVDVFNVPKDYLQLLITEHVPSLPALLQVALHTKEKSRMRMFLTPSGLYHLLSTKKAHSYFMK